MGLLIYMQRWQLRQLATSNDQQYEHLPPPPTSVREYSIYVYRQWTAAPASVANVEEKRRTNRVRERSVTCCLIVGCLSLDTKKHFHHVTFIPRGPTVDLFDSSPVHVPYQ